MWRVSAAGQVLRAGWALGDSATTRAMPAESQWQLMGNRARMAALHSFRKYVRVSNPEDHNMYSKTPLCPRGTGQGMVFLLEPFNF